MQKVPFRRDLLTYVSFPKDELTRIIVIENKPVLDLKQEIKARGYYIKIHSELNIEKHVKKLSKILKVDFDNGFIDSLKKIIKEAKVYEKK